jgi:uncharacterized protein YdeI (YjbR/CyaY-like superfamily)
VGQDEAEIFHPHSLAEWRDWLAEHHDRGAGVWLVSWRRASGREPLPYEDLVLEALCWGWVDSTVKTIDDERSRMWVAPRRPRTSTWVRSNKERVARLEAEGRMQPAGRALVEAAKANGMWTVLDDAEAGVEHPLLTKALDADPAARASWDALPPSVRKQALTQMALARTDATKAKRVAAIVAACAEGRRPS